MKLSFQDFIFYFYFARDHGVFFFSECSYITIGSGVRAGSRSKRVLQIKDIFFCQPISSCMSPAKTGVGYLHNRVAATRRFVPIKKDKKKQISRNIWLSSWSYHSTKKRGKSPSS